ncbi:MAG: CBS domain-containing protein, partial [Gemmatimonadaceae bacterium]
MRLRDVLAPERLVVPLEAGTLPEAAEVLLGRLGAAHGVLDLAKLRRRVAEGRPEDAVAMGDRAFLLHYRTDAVGQLVVALGVSRTIICRRSVEEGEQCARIVLMIAAPPRHAARYLQVVGGFARLLRKAEVLASVLAATVASALATLVSFGEYMLPEQLTFRDVMSEQPRTIEPEALLKEAARILVRTGLGALPVVDDERRV